ncbi:MAG TPA: hypothetical protein VM734_22385 [Kofleriaceae bacterium]|nr:hypothetical protein [Kofleriaceae bacterium]
MRRLAWLSITLGVAGVGAAGCGPGDDGGGTCAGILPGELVITEVLADYDAPTGSSGADEGHEWFEVYNASSRPIELRGVVVSHGRPDGGNAKTHVMTDVTITPGQYLVLGNVLPDLAPAHVDYGYAADLGDLYNTGGGKLALRCGDTLVDEAIYDAVEAGRSRSLDGGGPPDYQANDLPTSWCDADETSEYEYEPANFGTPGAGNQDCLVVIPGSCDDGGTMRATVPPQVGDLTITEVMPSPAAVSAANGEWFEVLVNRDVDINDLGLDRVDDTAAPVILASATCRRVTAGEYLVFARNPDMAANGGIADVDGTFGFAIVNGTTAQPTGIRLMMGATELDVMTWTSARSGRAIQLDAGLTAPTDNDLSTNLCDATAPYGAGDLGTPGEANTECGTVTTGMCMDTGTGTLRPIVKPTAGQLVIDEWMPNPSGTDTVSGEWFELRATADVDLNGLQAGTTSLGSTPLIPAGGDCVRVATGARAVFHKTGGNGLPETVTVTGRFGFALTNASGSLQVGVDGAALATATWAVDPNRASFMIDSSGDQCTAAEAGVALFNGVDRGTPGTANSPPECP